MLTRFETTSGRLEVSATKPAAMTKASVAFSPKPNADSMAMTIGVRISAAPSLANRAATVAPSSTINAKRRRPRPRPQRATCSAAHSNEPASSRIRLIRITATKVAVAFHTMCQTTGMSEGCTTPASSATRAPPHALQPMPRPLGCQITSVMVTTKMARARITAALRMKRYRATPPGPGTCVIT